MVPVTLWLVLITRCRATLSLASAGSVQNCPVAMVLQPLAWVLDLVYKTPYRYPTFRINLIHFYFRLVPFVFFLS